MDDSILHYQGKILLEEPAILLVLRMDVLQSKDMSQLPKKLPKELQNWEN